jgi:predicted DNA-binding transcriptional regulator AlpA
MDNDDRLIPKKELLQLVQLSFPTVWKMMIAGQFPRARQIGGKTVWLKSEIDQYLAALPLRPYKGDLPQTESEIDPKAADRKLKPVASNEEESEPCYSTDSSDESG